MYFCTKCYELANNCDYRKCLVVLPQRQYETLCVCYHQSSLWDSVCLCSMDFVSGSNIEI